MYREEEEEEESTNVVYTRKNISKHHIII